MCTCIGVQFISHYSYIELHCECTQLPPWKVQFISGQCSTLDIFVYTGKTDNGNSFFYHAQGIHLVKVSGATNYELCTLAYKITSLKEKNEG